MKKYLNNAAQHTAGPPAPEELEIINSYALVPMAADEVFVFSVVLCDNEIDRDYDAFTEKALNDIATLYVGKTGIFDHNWGSEKQTARIFSAVVERGEGKTKLGEKYMCVKARAYIPVSSESNGIISKIKGGILKEVSVGLSAGNSTCNVCGENQCEHNRGEMYDGKIAARRINNVTDVYEWSFVAVPAQPAAGVTKSYKFDDIEKAFEVLEGCDLTQHRDRIKSLFEASQTMSEKEIRKQILENNKKIMEAM